MHVQGHLNDLGNSAAIISIYVPRERSSNSMLRLGNFVHLDAPKTVLADSFWIRLSIPLSNQGDRCIIHNEMVRMDMK